MITDNSPSSMEEVNHSVITDDSRSSIGEVPQIGSLLLSRDYLEGRPQTSVCASVWEGGGVHVLECTWTSQVWLF